MIRSENSNVDVINISNLLEIFDLDLELSEEVLNIRVDDCFKSARLLKDDDKYSFERKYIIWLKRKKVQAFGPNLKNLLIVATH